MEKIISLIVVFVLLVSCASTRKIQETKSTSYVDSMNIQEVSNKNLLRFIDTTYSDRERITVTEIEFDSRVLPDTSIHSLLANATLLNIGRFTGVKSIKQRVIESDVVKKGESHKMEKQWQYRSDANTVRKNKDIRIQETPVADPYRWRYIVYIALLSLIVLLYLKRIPVLEMIKKLLSVIRRVL